MTMPNAFKSSARPLALLLAAALLLPAAGAGANPGRKDEQDEARKALLEGNVMPFSMIKRRVDREMGDASYLGSEFLPDSNRYRLKYVKDGKVVWVDVDGRTGDIMGWAR
ncbi:MAG: hypothetical protein U5M50_10865 [Sphingobium sp.]|nr:hypothetical protein [Sphingobium sp.]